MDEFYEKVKQYFTPAELIDFLSPSMDQVLGWAEDLILERYADLVDEICFDLTSGEEDERD